jgi:pimeloyl-ACP methyl ester carboxylesterase
VAESSITESVLHFGPDDRLLGVLTLPAIQPDGDGDERPAVVMLNAGIIHHVGPNRLHVRLARSLAEAGFPCFRFDLAGIGDSPPLGTAASVSEEHVRSVAEALDTLEMNGLPPRFVLFGLCSGASLGFRVTRDDPRVAGLIFIDPPQMLRTPRYYRVRAINALKRPQVWRRFLSGRYGVVRHLWNRLAARWKQRSGGDEPSRGEMRARIEQDLCTMLARDVDLFLIVTGGLAKLYNYREQFFELFPKLRLDQAMRMEYHASAQHTFADRASRQRLISEVLDWLQTRPLPVRARRVRERAG